MMEQEYTLLWAAYIVAGLFTVLCCAYFTRWLWRWLREVICLLAAAIIFTPTLVDVSRGLKAPAVGVVALDALLHTGINIATALPEIVVTATFALGIYIVFAIIRFIVGRLWRRYQRRRVGSKTRLDQMRENLEEKSREDDDEDFVPSSRIEPRL